MCLRAWFLMSVFFVCLSCKYNKTSFVAIIMMNELPYYWYKEIDPSWLFFIHQWIHVVFEHYVTFCPPWKKVKQKFDFYLTYYEAAGDMMASLAWFLALLVDQHIYKHTGCPKKNETRCLLNISTTKYWIFKPFFFSWKLRSIRSCWILKHFWAILGGRDICETKWDSWLDDSDQNSNYLI